MRIAAGFTPSPQLVLVGGEADERQFERLAQRTEAQSLLAFRDLPLPHLAAVLERARLFVGHDSGISHIAAAAGAPALLLFGPTDPSTWAPANERVEVIEAPDGNLRELGVERVATAAEECWKRAAG